MKYTFTIILASLVCVAGVDRLSAGSIKNHAARWSSQMYPWHGDYYDAAWGMPVALVVPPTAENQTKWGWGVGNTRVMPIEHQFQRDYPGEGIFKRSWFLPTPRWPSDTDQFGDYYIRGPW
jgi:hypothetical protein